VGILVNVIVRGEKKMGEFDKAGENDSEIIIRILSVKKSMDIADAKKWEEAFEYLNLEDIGEVYTKKYNKIISKLPPNCKLISVVPADSDGESRRFYRRHVLFFEVENSSPKKRKNIKYQFINISISKEDGFEDRLEWRLGVYNRKLSKALEEFGGNARVIQANWHPNGWFFIIENEE